MKKLIIILFFGVLCFQPVWSQANCSTFYPMIEGASFEYTNYGKKGKSDGVTSYTIAKVSNDDGNTSATMVLELSDEKGDEVYSTDYNITCAGDFITIDYKSLIPGSMLEQYKDLEMNVSGTDLELPNNLTVGQQLADANVAINIKTSGININSSVDMINRKVQRQESITTPAGTFDCYVIYSENNVKASIIKQKFSSRIWLAEGIGMVKQETYNKNGKLTGSTKLTAYSK